MSFLGGGKAHGRRCSHFWMSSDYFQGAVTGHGGRSAKCPEGPGQDPRGESGRKRAAVALSGRSVSVTVLHQFDGVTQGLITGCGVGDGAQGCHVLSSRLYVFP